MSILDTVLTPTNLNKKTGEVRKGEQPKYDYPVSNYSPTDEARAAIAEIKEAFALGDVTMHKPRREFNDLSLVERIAVDAMSFNTYQPNDGDPTSGNELDSWKSRAMRPITRNKCISVTAHAMARTIFPKLFAYDSDNQVQEDAALMMSSLLEWSGNGITDETDYIQTSLLSMIQAVSSPAAILYHEYAETYRTVKTDKDPKTGKWNTKEILDEDQSGFITSIIPPDWLYIENIFEADVQKQAWLIMRKTISYNNAKEKYAEYDNIQYVKPGVQLIYNDPNQVFYEVYDQNMRPHEVEEVIFWHKGTDRMLIAVNGVLLTDPDNPNPRMDKLYPFEKFGYEIIKPKFFYYKSLASKVMQDEKILNTLYQMVIDGTYMGIMPPLINVGGEIIASDVFIPGSVTTLQNPQSEVKAIGISQNLQQGLEMLTKVEESISDSTESPQGSPDNSGSQTAYQISVDEKNAETLLGLFLKMIRSHVKQYGRLRIGDIKQYITVGQLGKIEGELGYKTILVHDTTGSGKHKKIIFDQDMPDEMTQEEYMAKSQDILDEQGGHNSDMTIYRANPELFRDLFFLTDLSDDVMSPMSDALERAFNLEEYDRLLKNPRADQDENLKLLLTSYPKTRRNPDKYISKQPVMAPNTAPTPDQNNPANPSNPLSTAGAALPPKSPLAKI